jgi:hypothetical protein
MAACATAGVIQQEAGASYVAFQAGAYDSITPSDVMTDNGDGTLTTTLSHNDGGPATLTYLIDFDTTGDYYWYFNFAAAGSSHDSLFVVSDFGAEPTSSGNSNRLNGLAGDFTGNAWMILNDEAGSGVIPTDDVGANPDYNSDPADGETFAVSEAGQLSLIMKSREAGLVWNAFVLSTSADLTADELNTIIPEPTTMGLLGLGVVGLLRRRR